MLLSCRGVGAGDIRGPNGGLGLTSSFSLAGWRALFLCETAVGLGVVRVHAAEIVDDGLTGTREVSATLFAHGGGIFIAGLGGRIREDVVTD